MKKAFFGFSTLPYGRPSSTCDSFAMFLSVTLTQEMRVGLCSYKYKRVRCKHRPKETRPSEDINRPRWIKNKPFGPTSTSVGKHARLFCETHKVRLSTATFNSINRLFIKLTLKWFFFFLKTSTTQKHRSRVLRRVTFLFFFLYGTLFRRGHS